MKRNSFPKKNKPAQDQQKTDDPIANNYRLAFIQGFAVLAISIVVYYGIASVIARLYHPNLQKALQFAREILADPSSAAPKPVEKLLSLTAMIFFPVSAAALFWLGRRYLRNIPIRVLHPIYVCSIAATLTAILFVAYQGFLAPNPFAANPQNIQDSIARTNFDFYFISTFLYDNFLWYCILIFPAILLYLLLRDRLPDRINNPLKKAEAILAYGFCAIITIAVFFISAFKFPYTLENKYDFNAVYYSVVQVYNGVPMLVNHFTNTYGQYPHFVVPVMKLFGLSVLSFSGIMGFLLSLCFIFLFLFLLKTIRSKLLILLAFTSVFYNCYMYFHLITPFDSSFAMGPIRWIFPFSLILFAAFYLQNRDKKAYYSSFLFFALGILWNPDFGMVSFLSLTAFYCFLEFENNTISAFIKKVLRHCVVAGISLVAAFSAYSLFIRIAYGSFPDLLQIFSTIKVFSIVGAGMLPTPSSFHPWMLVALIYLIGIAISVYHIVNRSISPRIAIVFLLTVIGVAAFQYYQGRSHNWNLFLSNPWCFILLGIFADDLLLIAKKHKIFMPLLAVAVFALPFSLFQTIYSSNGIVDLVSENKNKAKNVEQQSLIVKNAEEIRREAGEKEKVLILSADYLQGIYYSLSHTVAAINPGFMDLFFKTDLERIISFLIENQSTKIFFDAASFRFFDQRIPALLASHYDIRNSGGSILYLIRKKENASGEFLLKSDSNTVYHEILDKVNKKVNAGEGLVGPVTLTNRFSIQVLFKPSETPATNFTNWKTVFSNRMGNTGFMLMEKTDDPAHYIFTTGIDQIDCPVNVEKWNYYAFEINNTLLRIFRDGKLLGAFATHGGCQNSVLPLYVGNYSMQGGFFWGDIKELEIDNGLLEERNIAATWENAINKLD